METHQIISDATKISTEIIDETQQKLPSYTYSINDMEELRFVNLNDQKMSWRDVYESLESDVAAEYDGLQAEDHSNKKKQKKKKKKKMEKENEKGLFAGSNVAGEMLGVKTTEGSNLLNICDGTVNCSGKGIDFGELLDKSENVDEDDSSNDEYGNIQRPAFLVEGEPDFDSGLPLDGFEYLRRVRWEAAQIPKVKVVKFNSSKLTSAQTAYMPGIPDIPKCPPELLPLKDWENAFLAEFSELRQAISNLEGNSSNEPSLNKESQSHGKQSNSIEQLKNTPTLTAILGMDAVSRAKALGAYISSLESIDVLSKDDCLWLFSLCAAVDTPLHADTCAALRCFLRKWSHLLALKSEPDDEVAMLSVLIAITGKYFGQLDS